MGKRLKGRVYDENGNVTHKVCSKCKELKSIGEFSVDKRSLDGCQCKCKKCDKEQGKQYYEKNKKQERERNKQYKEEHKGQIKEYKKQ